MQYKNILFLILAGFSLSGLAQKQMKVNKVSYSKDAQEILIEINASNADGTPMDLDGSKLRLSELIQEYNATDPLTINRIEKKDNQKVKAEPNQKVASAEPEQLTFLFLLDVSGSMRDTLCSKPRKVQMSMKKAKDAVIKVMKSGIPVGTTFISTFGDVVTTPEPIDNNSAPALLERLTKLPPCPKAPDTDLYFAIQSSADWIKAKPGKKIILLLSDGADDTRRNPRYDKGGITRIKPDELFARIKEISVKDTNLQIFPVGIGGAQKDFLQKLTDATVTKADSYSYEETPDSLGIFQKFREVAITAFSNYTIRAKNTVHPSYRGEPRNLKVELVEDASINNVRIYSVGTANNCEGLCATQDKKDWIKYLVLGILILALALMSFIYAVPMYKNFDFKRKYVKRYSEIKKPGMTQRDPVTDDSFEDDDLVVVRCNTITSLGSWEYCGNRCPAYSDCLRNMGCKGEGAGEEQDTYWSMKGIYKHLNWIWSGFLGGFIAWIILAVWKLLRGLSAIANLQNSVATALNKKFSAAQGTLFDKFGVMENALATVQALSDEMLTGFALGTAITGTLSWIEEKGGGRKLSWGRIILRMVLSGIIFAVLFPMGTFGFQYLLFKGSPYPGGLVVWTLFGLLMGIVLSIKSSISIKRGMMGGTIAGIVAYHVYFFVPRLFSDSQVELSKLIGFIILGGILAIFIVAVVSRLEDFEMEILQPEKFRRSIPISKWLKQGLIVHIGRDEGVYMYIPWMDESIHGRHAQLTYDSGKVSIEALATPTAVNGTNLPVGKKLQLKDRDMIQIGNGATKMMYKEKRVIIEGQDKNKPTPPSEIKTPFTPTSKKEQYHQEQETRTVIDNSRPNTDGPKPKINIKKR